MKSNKPKRQKPPRTITYIRAVIDRLERRRWSPWKQQDAYEKLNLERHMNKERQDA